MQVEGREDFRYQLGDVFECSAGRYKGYRVDVTRAIYRLSVRSNLEGQLQEDEMERLQPHLRVYVCNIQQPQGHAALLLSEHELETYWCRRDGQS